MNKPWLDHYDPSVPRSIGSYPSGTLVDFMREHARSRPDAVAIAFKGRTLTFAEIDEASDALANGLAAEGVAPHQRVALLLPNCPQFIIAELAIWKLGAVVVPQNPIYTAHELEISLNIARPETAITLTAFYERLKSCQPRTSVQRVIATNIKEYLPAVSRLLFTLALEKKEGHRIRLRAGDLWFQELIRHGAGQPAPRTASGRDDAAVILMSGGTTGTPKGVLTTHGALVMSGTQLQEWLKEPLAAAGSSLMLPLPLFHTYGFAGAQSVTMIRGLSLILVPNPRDIADLLKTINRDKPTLVCGVPALFAAMITHPDVARGRVDFRSIKACFSGAAALMAETKRRFEELTGGRIVEGYSLTEATMACCANPFRGPNKTGSVGMPLPDVEVRIVESEGGRTILPAGEMGEIILRAPQLMAGYCNNPEETAEVLRLRDDGTLWLYTGDLGYLDEDGYLFIIDRKKDLIKSSGYQVWPREVEEVIAAHPAVAEVGVAGLPDERKGEIVAAWIVPRPDAGQIDEHELARFCRQKLTGYKVPSYFEFRSELPKTMVGKILRRQLVAEAKAAMEVQPRGAVSS